MSNKQKLFRSASNQKVIKLDFEGCRVDNHYTRVYVNLPTYYYCVVKAECKMMIKIWTTSVGLP